MKNKYTRVIARTCSVEHIHALLGEIEVDGELCLERLELWHCAQGLGDIVMSLLLMRRNKKAGKENHLFSLLAKTFEFGGNVTFGILNVEKASILPHDILLVQNNLTRLSLVSVVSVRVSTAH